MRDPDLRRPPPSERAGSARRPERPTESIEYLEAEARYHRERLALYRAKRYGPKPTRPAHMRELERAAEGAAANLRRARERAATAAGKPAP